MGLVTADAALEQALGRLARERGLSVTVGRSEAESGAILGTQGLALRVIDLGQGSPIGAAARDALRQLGAGDDVVVLRGSLDPSRGRGAALQALRFARADLAAHADELLGELLPARPGPDPARLILGQSESIRHVCAQIRAVARFRDVSVLVLGETGTGKELVARALHELSAPEGAPFVAVNCAAIPATLFESELFGYEAGSFTGAKGARAGVFETAGDGTLFLDEVGELPADLQPKLLRALETREFRRVGGSRPLPLRARVVSATNQGLEGVQSSTLRLDLHFRLAGFTIELPPLRSRAEDVESLARHFLAAFAERNRVPIPRLTEAAVQTLVAHAWPGNVRQLRASIEHAAIVALGDAIDDADLARALGRGSSPEATRVSTAASGEHRIGAESLGATPTTAGEGPAISGLRRIERDLILAAFEESEHNLTVAARVLGMPRSTLRDKLRRYGVLGG